MQPIFPEYINFLRDHDCDVSWFQENTFWLDNNMIKGFLKKKGGQLIPLYRVLVDDDLNITLVRHKKNKGANDYETWSETICRYRQHIDDIERQSIQKLRSYKTSDREIISLNSTGKDSMVVTHLATKAGIPFETYFNVTTLDVAESNIMANKLGFKKIPPSPRYGGFYQYCRRYDGGAIN